MPHPTRRSPPVLPSCSAGRCRRSIRRCRPVLSSLPTEPPAPFHVASDGFTLSADGATLYYCPLSSRHLYSVPTDLLLDRSASPTSCRSRRMAISTSRPTSFIGSRSSMKKRICARSSSASRSTPGRRSSSSQSIAAHTGKTISGCASPMYQDSRPRRRRASVNPVQEPRTIFRS